MKYLLLAMMTLLGCSAVASTPEIRLPDPAIALIKSADYVEVKGTNDLGGAEDFSIHNSKAIGLYVKMLTSDRFIAVPKNLKPQFKSLSLYKVRLSAKGAVVLEFQIIADSIIDLPGDASYYMQSDRYSDNLLAPLLRLR